MRGLGIVLAMLLGLGAVTSPARAQDEPVRAKIVVQSLPVGGVEVAAWIKNDQYILTANAVSRAVLIWDVATGNIVDRLVLPSDNPDSRLSVRRLTGIELSEDGKVATISGESASVGLGDTEAVTRAFGFRLDLEAREFAKVVRAVNRMLRSPGARAGAMIESNAALAALLSFEEIGASNVALETISNGASDPERRKQADALLPALPAAGDGRKLARGALGGLTILAADGSLLGDLTHARTLRFSDAQLSPLGSTLAMVEEADDTAVSGGGSLTYLQLLDIETGSLAIPRQFADSYSQVQWIDTETVLVSQASTSDDRLETEAWARGPPPPMIAYSTAIGTEAWQAEARCHIAVAGESGAIYGAGHANCRAAAGKDRTLQRYDTEGKQWRPFGTLKLAKDAVVEMIAVAPSGGLLVVAVTNADKTIELFAFDGRSGKLVDRKPIPGGGFISKLSVWDTYVEVAANGAVTTWLIDLPDDQDWAEVKLASGVAKVMETDGTLIAVSGVTDDVIGLWNMDTDQALEPLDFSGVIAGGFLLDRPVFWALSITEGLRMWSTTDFKELYAAYFFQGGGFLAVTPEGRYDTNLGPDSRDFRWIVSDRPWQSLGAQTFMRDYFEPNLIARTAQCTLDGDCAMAFGTVRPIAELNRVVPTVEIESLEQGTKLDEAVVRLKVSEGYDPEAPPGKQRSGIYNLRLFRDFRVIEEAPVNLLMTTDDLAGWRDQSKLEDMDDQPSDGIIHVTATIKLPTESFGQQTMVSAYAFNADRIKSDTDVLGLTLREVPPVRPKRAYVINIGVDDYFASRTDHRPSRLDLNYAAADAKLMNERLGSIISHEVRALLLAGERGGKHPITADTIRYALGLLSTAFPRDEMLAALKLQGIDGSPIEPATPDDLVIITFSGHGWTAPDDDFYLLAGDAEWPDKNPTPTVDSLISASELALWLRPVDAGDIAFIIDACHAGASIDKGNFKPGPFGDAGLGQLAYDKGIRILVATQASDVAMEDARLKHGLLTFALAGEKEGLARRDGALDLNGDEAIDLTEWLAYPVWRLLYFNDDERLTGDEDDADSVTAFSFPNRAPVAEKRVQEPSLYDYSVPTRVLLKQLTP